MKILPIILGAAVLSGVYAFTKYNESSPVNTNKKSIYDFVVKDIQGNDFDFATLKGKKIMIVNTASKCGLTPQYEQLEEIYQKYKDLKDFVIVGFPSNNFFRQEPGNDQEIAQFCQLNYGVSFPMMHKIEVKGKDQHEIYQFLTHKSLNTFKDSKVKWNFQKYLISKEGKLEKIISPKTKPNAQEVIDWIEQ